VPLKLFLVLCVGFVASFVGAMCMGFFLRITLQMTSSSGNFFEPEVAGTVTLMTACYILVNRYSR
jgi:hypothetical protein